MSPQSSRRMRPSCSTHAQLRPISPSPPRNVMRTGSATPADASGRRRGAVLRRGGHLELHALVLGAGVLPVLVLEDAELAEALPQPARLSRLGAGIEKPE